MKEFILKWLTISYLSALTIIGALTLIFTTVFLIDSYGDTDPNPMCGILAAFMVLVQLVGFITSVLTTLNSYSSYSEYARYTLIPLSVWASNFLVIVIFRII